VASLIGGVFNYADTVGANIPRSGSDAVARACRPRSLMRSSSTS
jgi:hypothetical protein